MEESQREDVKVAIMAVIAELREIEGGGKSNDSKKAMSSMFIFLPMVLSLFFSNLCYPTPYFLLPTFYFLYTFYFLLPTPARNSSTLTPLVENMKALGPKL
jgi:hypothetical protein